MIFQVAIPISETTEHAVALGATYATSQSASHAPILEAIEAEGWRLEHAGYVYRLTGSVSRDRFLASGQREAFGGEIVGVYLFRCAERPSEDA
jgi:hypothetical protein